MTTAPACRSQALGRTLLQVYRHHHHDWTDWQPISDPGVEEQLHERFCPTCGHDEIGVDERMGSGRDGHRRGELTDHGRLLRLRVDLRPVDP